MKIKLILKYPIWYFKAWRCKRMMKKERKNPGKYEVQWKFNHVMKTAIKIIKDTNVKLNVIGYKNLPKGVALLTPNHQSNLDPLIIIAAMKKQTSEVDIKNKMCLFLSKMELKKHKSISYWAEFIDTQYIDRKNPKTALISLNKLAKIAKRDKKYIVIFPEGTRSKDGEIHEFISGSFRIAKKEFIPIVPITINNSYSYSDYSRKGKLEVTVIIHPKIKPSQFMTKETKFIARKIQNIVQSSWIKPNPIKCYKRNKLNG